VLTPPLCAIAMQVHQFYNVSMSSLDQMYLHPRHCDKTKCLVTNAGEMLFACFQEAVVCPTFKTGKDKVMCFPLAGECNSPLSRGQCPCSKKPTASLSMAASIVWQTAGLSCTACELLQ
jgi:hypothetical protein